MGSSAQHAVRKKEKEMNADIMHMNLVDLGGSYVCRSAARLCAEDESTEQVRLAQD